MSELEFRAWAIKKNEFIDDVIHDGESWLECEGYETSSLSEIFYGDEFIVEQYTGIKDKHGKKVYIGDIVLVANHGLTPYVATECDCSFVFKNENLIDFVYMFKTMPQCYEIIGNIHETPELINSENESKECEE